MISSQVGFQLISPLVASTVKPLIGVGETDTRLYSNGVPKIPSGSLPITLQVYGLTGSGSTVSSAGMVKNGPVLL